MGMVTVTAMASATAKTQLKGERVGRLRPALIMVARAAASAALFVAAGQAWQFSDRRHVSGTDAVAAYTRYPHDPEAVSGAYSERLTRDPAALPGPADADNARKALLARPLAPRLMFMLAIRAKLDGQPRLEQGMMRLADRITRRDPLVQLWLIEDTVARGDVPGALRHYHAALTVGPELKPMLLPVLAAALTHPEIRAGLRPYLADHADWVPDFLELAAQTAGAADLADLVMPVAGSLTGPAHDHTRAAVISALAIGGGADLAYALVSKTIADLKAANLRTLAFTPATTDPRLGVLAWNLPQSDQIASSVGDDGSLSAQVGQLARGTLAARDVPVLPGRTYEFLHEITYEGRSLRARISWSGQCIRRSNFETIWQQVIPATDKPVTFRSVMRTTPNCHLLRITASVEGGDAQLSSSLHIRNLQLHLIRMDFGI